MKMLYSEVLKAIFINNVIITKNNLNIYFSIYSFKATLLVMNLCYFPAGGEESKIFKRKKKGKYFNFRFYYSVRFKYN